MPQLKTKKGQQSKLVTHAIYQIGAGWTPAPGQDSDDLDLWCVRKFADGRHDFIYWGRDDLERPDLGTNGEGNPFIATVEGDVTYKGDDRTGATSDTGYDENMVIDLSSSPAELVQYALFLTNFEELEDGQQPSKVLAAVSDIVCGVKQEGSNNELVVSMPEITTDSPFAITVLVATLDRDGDNFVLTDKREAYDETMFEIAKKLDPGLS